MLVALSRINQVISRVRLDPDQLVNDTASTIYDELGYDVVWMGEVRRDGEIIRAASQGLQASALEANAPPPALVSQVRATAEQGRPKLVHCADLGLDGAVKAAGPAAVLPAAVGQDLVIALVVVRSAGETFGNEEVSLLQEMASDVAYALETVESERRTRMAEEALRISEDRFRRLSEHATVGIVLIQNDLYRYVNPAFARMFGYDAPRDIIDQLGPLDLTAPDDRRLVADAIEKRILGQVRAASLQYRGLRRDGRVFDVEEHGARTVHAQRLAVIATILDVTEREASRRRLEALATTGLALSAAQTPQQALDGAVGELHNILPCNAACIIELRGSQAAVAARSAVPTTTSAVAALIDAGVPLAQIPGIRPLLGDRTTVVLDVAHFVAPGQPGSGPRSFAGAPLVVRGDMIGVMCAEATVPDQFTEEDGRHLRLFADHVAATVQHLRLVSSLEAERNRLRVLNALSHALAETLRVQEVATRALVQIGPVLGADAGWLFLWDGETGVLTTAGIAGVSAESAAALTRGLVNTGPELASRINEWHRGGASGRGPHWNVLGQLEYEDAQLLDLPLEAHGELVGILSFATQRSSGFDADDADLVLAFGPPVGLALQNARYFERAASQAAAMATALRRQEELDRMKDELIQNVSHELRTPLALVMGYAEILESGRLGPLSQEQAEAIGIIVRRSRMLRSLVEDIALLWHLERRMEDLEQVNLTETVTMAVADFSAQAEAKGLSIAADTPHGAVKVLGIPLQLRRVLDNLISNALKFTPRGGTISVSLSSEDGWATMQVSDTGIGVSKEHLDLIFERFYQVDGSAKRKYGGTGLGLALVKAIVERHRGTIAADSPISDDPDHPGTRFVVQLPLCMT
jgi:PAS domain S-box-containing protein